MIDYTTLVQAFFHAHDPTTLNRQGPDEGTDYKSVAFYRDENERKTLEKVISSVNSYKVNSKPIVTEVVPFKILYPAENYHQGYYKQHLNNGYIVNVAKPKVLKLRKAMPTKLKIEYQNKPS